MANVHVILTTMQTVRVNCLWRFSYTWKSNESLIACSCRESLVCTCTSIADDVIFREANSIDNDIVESQQERRLQKEDQNVD